MHYDLRYIDLEQKTMQPLENPFGPEVVTDISGTDRYPCLRSIHLNSGSERGTRTPDQRIMIPLL